MNQLPFTSINYGADTSFEGKKIIESLLRGSLKGVGKFHRTSIFPCGIFQFSKYINGLPGTPNYKLFKKAISSTVRRFYPNYFNLEWSVQTKGIALDRQIKQNVINKLPITDKIKLMELFIENPVWLPKLNLFLTVNVKGKKYKIYNAEDMKKYKNIHGKWIDFSADMDLTHQSPTELGATMGCVYGKEKLYYKINGKNYHTTFIKMWKKISELKGTEVLVQPGVKDERNVFVNLKDFDVFVWDSHGDEYVKVLCMNRNISTKFIDVIFNNHTVTVTDDHPFTTTDNPLIFARDLKPGMQIESNDSNPEKSRSCLKNNKLETVVEVKQTDIPINKEGWEYSYDLTTESEHFTFSGIYSHNCRTYNGFDINFTEEYFKELLDTIIISKKLPKNYLYSAMQKDGRGNVAPNTIILPTIAMEAKEIAANNGKPLEEVFLEHLAETIDEAKDELLERFEWICKQPAECAKFTYFNNVIKGFKPEEGIRSALKHGTLAIGQIALAETLQILVGCDHTEPKGMELAHKIESLFASKCAEYKKTYSLNFGVYYTPRLYLGVA